MWTHIKDCGKQLTVNTKVREVDDRQVKVYKIIEVEFDQYKLELVSRDDVPPPETLHQVLTCPQLVQFGFELEVAD
jgi:hypothetical protein